MATASGGAAALDLTCAYDERPVKARGMCGAHLGRFYRHGDPHVVLPPGPARRPPAQAFAARTVWGPVSARRPDLGPCLLWTGPPNSNGYGTGWDGQRPRPAHVLAVLLAGRDLAPGEQPDHLCGVRLCVRYPEHLEVVPAAVNLQRAIALREARRAARRAAAAGVLLVPA